MVVVGVGAQDGGEPPRRDGGRDRVRVVRGVDDHAFGVVAQHPDVVVHVPGTPSRENVPDVTRWFKVNIKLILVPHRVRLPGPFRTSGPRRPATLMFSRARPARRLGLTATM